MIILLTAIYVIFCTMFPLGYILYVKGEQKLIFVLSCFGVTFFAQFLLTIILGVIVVFGEPLFPEITEGDISHYPMWALSLIEFVQYYGWLAFVFALYLLNVVVTIGLFRKFEIFHPR